MKIRELYKYTLFPYQTRSGWFQCWLQRLALFPGRSLTEEVVPFCVQVGLVGQTPTHHIQTVILAGFQGHLA